MGWGGTYCDGSLSEIKRIIEGTIIDSGFKTDGLKFTQNILSHSFKYGVSYMAVEQIEERENEENKRVVIAYVVMWKYDKKESEVMLKVMDETCGPGYRKPTKKILNLLTPSINDYSFNWRVDAWSQFKNIPREYQNKREKKAI